jgi:ABC-type Fe3+/spermidine/putrescine transport system ATPase subunit
MSDTVAVMKDGRVLQAGAPRDIYERPTSRFVASFLGASNILPATIRGRDGADAVVDVGGALLKLQMPPDTVAVNGSAIQVSLRPEKIRITSDGAVSATVSEIVYRGAQTHLYMEMNGAPLAAHFSNASVAPSTLAPGDTVRLTWDEGSMVVLT